MIDEPKTHPDQVRSQESRAQGGSPASGEAQSTSPSMRSTFGDPALLPFGGKTKDGSKKTDPPKTSEKGDRGKDPRSRGESDEDAGEGHKGPRVDATHLPTDHRS